jgi:hypothetical protein
MGKRKGGCKKSLAIVFAASLLISTIGIKPVQAGGFGKATSAIVVGAIMVTAAGIFGMRRLKSNAPLAYVLDNATKGITSLGDYVDKRVETIYRYAVGIPNGYSANASIERQSEYLESIAQAGDINGQVMSDVADAFEDTMDMWSVSVGGCSRFKTT